MIKEWIPLWTLPVVVVLAILTVTLRLSIVNTSYEVNQLNHMIQNTKLEKEQAEFRLATQRSPRRLETLAKNKFRLSPPRPEQVIRLR